MLSSIRLKTSKVLCVILSLIILIPCFSVHSFADQKRMNYAGYSTTVHTATVTVPKFKWSKPNQKEVITVVNDGKAAIDVYIGTNYRQLSPGKSYSIHYRTAIYGGNKIKVKILPKTTTYGKQYVRIQSSSSNNIKIIG